MIVILDPEGQSLLCLFNGVELGSLQKLVEDGLPEPFDLAQGHWMMGPRPDVPYPVLLEFLFEPGSSPPVGILSPVVCEHLLGYPVLGRADPVCLDHVFCRLAPVEPEGRDVTGVVVYIADQIGILAGQTERENISLPHLIGRGSLKTAGLGGIFSGLFSLRRSQPFFCKGLSYGLRAAAYQEKSFHEVRDPAGTVIRVFPFDGYDGLLYRWGDTGSPGRSELWFEAFFPEFPVRCDPALNSAFTCSEFVAEHGHAVSLFKMQLHKAQPEGKRERS